MLIRAFARPDEAVLMHNPCFPLYRIYANCEGRKPIFVDMGADFDPVMDQYIEALKKHRPKIVNLPLFDVPLSHFIMRPSIAVPRPSVFQTASD